MTLLVFFAFFGLYLAALPPALAPYRDAGEMAASAFTLGVSHPTSYPLYVLLARLSQAFPLGNPAYRLSLLSALAAAAAVTALCRVCARRWGAAAGLGAALLLGLNATFWSVAVVQEMYTLWILGAAVLLAAALELREKYDERLWLGFCLLYGVCLANRLDLVLWAPGLLWLALGSWDEERAPAWASLAFLVFPALLVWSDKNALIVPLILGTVFWRYRGQGRWSWALKSAAAGGLGLALYAYLPLRSGRGPWLDWNHPAQWANFLESVLRTKYGGTLDLLSKSYPKGSQLGVNLQLYGAHLRRNFSAAGLAAVLAGCAACARKDARRWLGTAAVYWWSGPVFLLMANMPPNPHAAAIVDPHYLASDLVLVFWAAEGLSLLAAPALAWSLVLLLAIAPFAQGRWSESGRREHLFSYDYARNVMRSAPEGAAVVAKKDVQLYTLWYYQTVQGWRPDLRVLAQGLSGSAWYQNGWRRRDPSFYVRWLHSGEDWKALASADAPLLATFDADVPGEVPRRSWGLLWSIAAGARDLPPDRSLLVRRGRYSYEDQPDFFTSDLVDSYSGASYAEGETLYAQRRGPEAAARFKDSWAMHWLYGQPPAFLGFMAFQAGDLAGAKRWYGRAAAISETLVGLADEYHALPEVVAAFRRASAEQLVQLGVVAERLHELESAKDYYRRSAERYPLAQAHYNLAVLSWGKDWPTVEKELEETLRLDSGNAEARKYLAALRSRRAP